MATHEEEQKSDLIVNLSQELGNVPEWLTEELGQCAPSGIRSILSFLKEASGSPQAYELVKKGFEGQWDFQHPDVRADPEFGSNPGYLQQLYEEAGLSLAAEPPNTPVTLPETADVEIRLLRSLLETGPDSQYAQVGDATIGGLDMNQILIVETYSGNRYLLQISDPERALVTLVMLNRRPGFPEDGAFLNLPCADFAVGGRLVTGKFRTSRIEKIYLMADAEPG